MAQPLAVARPPTLIGRLLLPLSAVAGLALIVVGLGFLADPHAGQNLLAAIYDMLGNSAGAVALRNNTGDVMLAKLLLAVVALAIGVGGVWLVYVGANALVGLLPAVAQARVLPWVFVGPALLLVTIYLVYPTIGTIIASVTENTGGDPLANYAQMITPTFLAIFRNNVIWLIVGTGGSVILGLVIAGLVDRVRREALAKTFVFLPLSISLVGASVIWRFIYQWQPEGQVQYGLLNAAWTSLGLDPVAWIQTPPINTFALIVILVWLQTGFCMVVLSAAIKGVDSEVMESARLDGASERQLFFKIVVPIIKGSIITVTTTTAIAVMKIFDIVFVMTGGRFDTDVVANRMFVEMFQYFNDGRAAALATVLFVAVLPLMIINVRNLRQQGIGA